MMLSLVETAKALGVAPKRLRELRAAGGIEPTETRSVAGRGRRAEMYDLEAVRAALASATTPAGTPAPSPVPDANPLVAPKPEPPASTIEAAILGGNYDPISESQIKKYAAAQSALMARTKRLRLEGKLVALTEVQRRWGSALQSIRDLVESWPARVAMDMSAKYPLPANARTEIERYVSDLVGELLSTATRLGTVTKAHALAERRRTVEEANAESAIQAGDED